MRVGFLGLGIMGTPMALNLVRRFPLTVWNRSAAKYPPLVAAGATVAETPAAVLDKSDVVFAMLFDEAALRRVVMDDSTVRKSLRGKILVNTSSVSVDFSRRLAQHVHEAGGHFVEMPVSGSRGPAERGQLVGMMAGDAAITERIRPAVAPLVTEAVYCGSAIGAGLQMKYAANLFLITTTVGLAESMNLARAQGLDPAALGRVLDAGPMASVYSRHKIAKMLRNDWSSEAAIKDCYNSTKLIRAAAAGANAQAPLINECGSLYERAVNAGLAEDDMIAVAKLMARGEEQPRHARADGFGEKTY